MSTCNCTGYCHLHGHCPNGETSPIYNDETYQLTPEQQASLKAMLEQVRFLNKQMDVAEAKIKNIQQNLGESKKPTPPKVQESITPFPYIQLAFTIIICIVIAAAFWK